MVLFISLVEGLIQLSTQRRLQDWIRKLLRGQKSGVRQKFGNKPNFQVCFTRYKAGILNHGRRGHSAIYDGEMFLVVGGYSDDDGTSVKNEVCSLNGSTMICVEQALALKKYAFYPELFLVSDDFGKDKNECRSSFSRLCNQSTVINRP